MPSLNWRSKLSLSLRGIGKGTSWPFRSSAPSYYSVTGLTVLKPFHEDRKKRRLTVATCVAILIGFCFLYGASFAFFAPWLMMPLIIPLVPLALAVLWALPRSRSSVSPLIGILLFGLVIALVGWPNYLAIAIPGLPWITVTRLIAFPLTLLFLVTLSMIPPFASRIGSTLSSTPWLLKLVLIFLFLQIISVAFSANKGASINILVNDFATWICPFFIAIYVFSFSRNPTRFVGLMAILSVGLSLIAVWEHHLGRLPWVGHIPSFFQINDPVVARIMAGAARLNQTVPRAQATFSTSLGFSEFLALTMPFALNFLFGDYKTSLRISAAIVVLGILTSAVFAQARIGVVGIAIAFLVYPLARGILHWREHPDDLLASSIVFATPLLAVCGLATAFIVPAIRYRLLGGGGEKFSNQGRLDQMHMGIPKVLTHPWGHGIGQGAETLGYFNLAGNLTIDSYPLRLALEYGVIGLGVFYGILISALSYGGLTLWRARSLKGEFQLILPACIAITSFMVERTVFSQEDNMPILFIMLGFLAALIHRREETER